MSQLQLWTEEDQLQLDHHEQVIENGLQALVDTAMSLRYIRDNRLYRNNYTTFEEYCFDRWGRKRRWADRMISAALVVESLNESPGTQMPKTEKQLRPLTKLDDPKDQQQAWENALNNSEKDQPTAKEVADEVEKLLKEKAELEQRNKDLALVVNKEREKNDQLAFKLQKTEEELGAITESKNRELQETLAAEIEKAKSDLEKTIDRQNDVIQKQQAEFERFKKNPDPETKRKMEEAHNALLQLESDRRQAESRLRELRTQEDHAKTNAIKVTRLKGALEKVMADHADGVIAISSPYMTEALLCDAETLANALHDFASRIEQSIDAHTKHERDKIKTVQVEVV